MNLFNNQFESFQFLQYNNENLISQSSTEEDNELINNLITRIEKEADPGLNTLYFMTKKNIEEDIPLTIFNGKYLGEESTEKDKKRLYYNSNSNKRFIIKKRGRKSKFKFGKVKIHGKTDKDNLLRKIQNHFLSFIIQFMNELFRIFNITSKLRKLNYAFKSNVKKKHVEDLKSRNIRDIICSEISLKYKKKTDNASICNNIDNKVLKKILSENYLKFFRNFYYNNSNKINLKEYGLDKDIYLSDKVKFFKDLSKEINSNKEYEINLEQFIKKNYFTNIFKVAKK